MLSNFSVSVYLCNVYWAAYYGKDLSFINWSELNEGV